MYQTNNRPATDRRLWRKRALATGACLLASIAIASCSDSSSSSGVVERPDDDDSEKQRVRYEITVTNMTANQPLSPLAVIAHEEGWSAWDIGKAASTALEHLAEGGSNQPLLASVDEDDATTVSGKAAVGPGGSETVSISVEEDEQRYLTLATMLVNTNDAFAGLKAVDISGLASGESLTRYAYIYDAGTELNSEVQGTIPGPADGGEGFNAARSDISNVVRRHGGVVSVDDGLASSVLDQSHRFDNPGMMVTITRR